MKRFIAPIVIVGGILLTTCVVYAQAITITSEQQSAFMSRAHVDPGNIVVPKMVDVPLSFEESAQLLTLVADESGAITPSTVITHTQSQSLHLTANDSFGGGDAHNMVDASYETFAEFPFVEGHVVSDNVTTVTDQYDNETRASERETSVASENTVDIDITANRPFTTDTLSLQLDDYITKPTHIRIASIDVSGKEHVLLPEKFYNQSTINFPKSTSDHFRITLKYAKPLRVNEITFSEQGIPQAIERFVRFVAVPQKTYDVYFNASERVKVSEQEAPNFNKDKSMPIITPMSITDNPLYKKADADSDGVIDRDDNCVTVSNSDQVDKDGNGIGDACEDFDHDGVMNALDNCPDTVNRVQADEDFDGIGDACDGTESRLMEKYSWIPYIALVAVFVIVTMLIIKTLKQK
ncbi:MAG: thrombospondin type 3 repeat-containing protein [Parcubacteria group bacterium]|jgi:hypothetical protein